MSSSGSSILGERPVAARASGRFGSWWDAWWATWCRARCCAVLVLVLATLAPATALPVRADEAAFDQSIRRLAAACVREASATRNKYERPLHFA